MIGKPYAGGGISMANSQETFRKEIKFHGRRGSIRQGALMDAAFLGWDSMSLQYGLVDADGMIPEETDRQHVHDYDQALFFISSDPDDMLHLGAEIEIDMGAEGIRFRTLIPRVMVIPKGTPHFSPVVRDLKRPFFFMSVNLTKEFKAVAADISKEPCTGPWNTFLGDFFDNFRELNFSANDPYHYGGERQQASDGMTTFTPGDAMGLPITFAWSTVKKPHNLGPWRADGKHHPHKHDDFDEALILLSLDLDDLTELHAVADFCTGDEEKDQYHHMLTKATVMAMPKGNFHLPLVFREVEKPCVFITIGNH